MHESLSRTLSYTSTEGTIVDVLKREGASVNPDDVVVVIETDKVSVDVRSPYAGAVDRLLVEKQQTVQVGADLLELKCK